MTWCPKCGKCCEQKPVSLCPPCHAKARADLARRQSLPVGGTSCNDEDEALLCSPGWLAGKQPTYRLFDPGGEIHPSQANAIRILEGD